MGPLHPARDRHAYFVHITDLQPTFSSVAGYEVPKRPLDQPAVVVVGVSGPASGSGTQRVASPPKRVPQIQMGKRGEELTKVKPYDVPARRGIDAELTRRSIDFMQRSVAAKKPFFAFIPLTQPHLPTLPHPDFDGKTGNGHYADVTAHVTTWGIPSGLDFGGRAQDLELVPGLQSVRLELAPACTLRFEFRVDGAALPYEDQVFHGLGRFIRAVGHEGRVQAIKYWLYEASAPGPYGITFEGVGTDRFLPIPPRVVDVREGETTEVIVDLTRK